MLDGNLLSVMSAIIDLALVDIESMSWKDLISTFLMFSDNISEDRMGFFFSVTARYRL